MRVAVLIGLVLVAAHSVCASNLDDDARNVDRTLNATYLRLMGQLPGEGKEALRDVQRAWLKFRDSTCAFERPIRAGSVRDWRSQHTDPSQDILCVQRLALERIAILNSYSEDLSREVIVRADKPVAINTHCSIENLPADFTVQAVGVHGGGLDTDVQLDSSGNETKVVEVIVNRPAENVVVVLMAYDPVLWQIKRTPDSNLVGVIVGGYHGQAVIGIDRSIPLLMLTALGRDDCNQYIFAYQAGPGLLKANAVVQGLTGREIDHLWSNYTGERVYIGARTSADSELIGSDDYKPEDYTSLPRFPSGQKGIDRLIEQGLLRRALPSDLQAWVEIASRGYARYNPGLRLSRPSAPNGVYVVLGKMSFPTGLYGGHSVAFLVGPGIASPAGNFGHSKVYFLADGTCRGVGC